jgi:hypothetical protein
MGDKPSHGKINRAEAGKRPAQPREPERAESRAQPREPEWAESPARPREPERAESVRPGRARRTGPEA